MMHQKSVTLTKTCTNVVHASPVARSSRPAYRQVLTTTNVASSGRSSVAPAPLKQMKRVLPLLSELVEINVSWNFAPLIFLNIEWLLIYLFFPSLQALTAAFETFAGRSAMIGFSVAAASELLLPNSGLFGQFGCGVQFSEIGGALVLSAAILAATAPLKVKQNLLEPILASLTSKQRSANSVAQRLNVDRALDSAMDAVFNSTFVRTVFSFQIEDSDVEEDISQ